ncbi:MAG: SDR family NAD(P)-dependent oxidoreductase, partial [Solirubrobacteraceae bacterium]
MRVALVTGAGGGIGRAIVERLDADGLTVVGTDVEAVDLADRDARAALVPDVLDRHGRIDVLVNNAAFHGARTPLLELAPEDWDRVLEVNLTATAFLSVAAARHMAEGGAIVNIAAIQEVLPVATYGPYAASKGGISALTRALAVELSPRGVRVNAVAPGGMNTPMIAGFSMPEGVNLKEFARVTSPLGYAEPEELAGLIAYIASDDAQYM